MTWKLSSNSKNNSRDIDPVLQKIRNRALEISNIDFGHPPMAGKRIATEQRVLFDNGKSKCDGTIKRSKHQDGLALDFFAFVDGHASWMPEHLTIVAIAFMKSAAEFGEVLDWGGFWSDGGKHYGWDCGHVELVRK